ncbi:MAG: hypothetical protein KIT68_13260 [Phycisphaeraceae bacterium]|nr:hypothetical protein [Phycisphaeraceae bacterium]
MSVVIGGLDMPSGDRKEEPVRQIANRARLNGRASGHPARTVEASVVLRHGVASGFLKTQGAKGARRLQFFKAAMAYGTATLSGGSFQGVNW